MAEIVRKIINIVIISVLRLLPLLAAFLSEADVLILSLYGRHFSLVYVLIRLCISIIVLFTVSKCVVLIRKNLLGDKV